MTIRKALVVAVSLLCALTVCAKPAAPVSSAVPDDLDMAIRGASDYLNENIPKGSKIVILNVKSDYADLSDYVIDELIANAVNDKIFSVVDRAQLEAIRTELKFQLSGDVDDNSALEIGKFLGAQTIVSGAVSELADRFRMRIRALSVQTAEVQAQYNRNMNSGKTIAALTKGGKTTPLSYGGGAAGLGASGSGSGGRSAEAVASVSPAQSAPSSPPAPPAPVAQPAAVVYKIGDTGPAGGLVFYDKGNNKDGWRYLEAAPVETQKQAVWVQKNLHDEVLGTRTEVGTGKRNTQIAMDYFNSAGGGFNFAVRVASTIEVNGFSDWFLPSKDELQWMYGNLHQRNLGGFLNENYWSSSGATYGGRVTYVWGTNFKTGEQWDRQGESDKYFVRAVRQF